MKKLVKLLMSLALVVSMSMVTSQASQRKYEVTFKSGSQGVFDVSNLKGDYTVNDDHTSVTFLVDAGSSFPDVPSLIINSGYRNNKWSETLPAVGSTVEEKQVFVAKYTKLVNAVEFTVRYVDSVGADLETPTIYTTDLNTEEVVRAKTIEGYQPDALQKRLVVSRENVEIQFVYTPTDQAESPVVEQIVEVTGDPVYVDVVVGAQTAGGAGGTVTVGDQAVPQAGAGEATTVEDQEVPTAGGETTQGNEDTEVIEDNEVAQAGAQDHSQYIMSQYLLPAVCGLVAVAAIVVYMISKNRKSKQH